MVRHLLAIDGMKQGFSSIACAVAVLMTVLVRAAIAELSFVTRTDFPAGPAPGALQAGRINADALADIIVANENGFSILLASAPGMFSTPLSVRTHLSPGSMAVADFDGDGHLDVA